MYQATAASISLHVPANPIRRLIERLSRDRAHSAEFTQEIGLVQRRLIALRGSAPTWHPLHLRRTVERTVAEPLRAILPQLRGGAARQVTAALTSLEKVGVYDSSIQDIDQAALLLADFAAGRRRA